MLWQQIQQDRARAYSQLVQERLTQTQNLPSTPRRIRRTRVPLIVTLGLLILGMLLILAIPLTVIATTSIMRDGLSCVSETLNIDGSTALQPLVEAMAQGYMQHCSGALITVGGGVSKTGLTHVEQGHGVMTDVNVQKDVNHVAGRDVPIGIGDFDIFASPVQGDLVDHQVAIGVFVMVLNQDVTGIHNLSTSQIQGIYTGVYQNWRQICTCGPNLPIVPVSRTINSGTRFTFEKYVLKGVATVSGLGLENTISSDNASQEVESTSGGSATHHSIWQARRVT